MNKKTIGVLVITCEPFFSEASLILNKLNSFEITNYFNCYLATKNITSMNKFFYDPKWKKITIPNKIKSWGEEMQFTLESIKEDYLLLWLDDFYPYKYIDLKSLEKLLTKAARYEPKIIRLNSIFNKRFAIENKENDIYFETKMHKYISSLVLPIFKKKFLGEIIDLKDSPWLFEKASKKRFIFNKKEFIYLKSPEIKLVNLVVKGEILNSSKRKLTKTERIFLKLNSTHRNFNIANEIFYLIKLSISRFLYYPFSYVISKNQI